MCEILYCCVGFGQLKGKAGDKYHKTWAMYFAKFIKAYEDSGIKIWGVTVQNEPSDGFLPGLVIYYYKCCLSNQLQCVSFLT